MDIPEKRLARRLKVNLPVTFQHLGGLKDFGETVAKDISSTGLRMNMDNFFPAHSNFLIKLRFPEVNRVIEGMARIVWSQRVSYCDQYQAGLKFYDLNPVFEKWMDEYIQINETLNK